MCTSVSQVDADLWGTAKFVDSVRLPYIAPSLGGVDSLIEQPTVISYWDQVRSSFCLSSFLDALCRLDKLGQRVLSQEPILIISVSLSKDCITSLRFRTQRICRHRGPWRPPDVIGCLHRLKTKCHAGAREEGRVWHQGQPYPLQLWPGGR